MKPSLGKTVYCIYCGEINKETVGYIGKDSFIVEEFSDNRMFDSLEYYYGDYNENWFTSLAKAKAKLLQDYDDGQKLKIVTLNENTTWGVELK